ncbi:MULTISPECIES: GNAT family N-acetyltransferase [Shewanella]|uniref:GNAT family N-acetyltransferase n=1 Tax=Shewanella psychromarinicola TaxID=2487742 RepID=A0A3N4E8R3_9GAMM|nr:GNAT family N-acetyltransferase [Shewanella psychromarinicola]AZG35010.1 GNAT family N-acetyltransferase [Shewanella psychromarinicola]MCL1080564.1 GNAT family N-acetyltransferase [Shewanella psychromarinicola]RPA33192.1 GNAT family N-acetyltransferase [Shewanella psychromarinicola]
MSFIIRKALLTDVAAIVQLERAHVDDELLGSNNQLHAHSLSKGEVIQLINQHWFIVAEEQEQIIGYVMAAKWSFLSAQPLYRHIIQKIKFTDLEGQTLSTTNSCQYGPVWIQESKRGKGVFSALVTELKKQVSNTFPFMITYVAADNARSLAAHQQKAAMTEIDQFSFEQRDYCLLATATATATVNGI